MQTLDFKIGFGRQKLADGEEPRTMRHHTWVATAVAGSAVLGAGVSMYGANKQSKDNRAAQDQNAQLQREQNNSAWQSYLMARGLNPMGAAAGTIPQGAPALNTKLPLWANVRLTSGASGNRLSTIPLASRSATPMAPAGGVGGTRTWQALGINR